MYFSISEWEWIKDTFVDLLGQLDQVSSQEMEKFNNLSLASGLGIPMEMVHWSMMFTVKKKL